MGMKKHYAQLRTAKIVMKIIATKQSDALLLDVEKKSLWEYQQTSSHTSIEISRIWYYYEYECILHLFLPSSFLLPSQTNRRMSINPWMLSSHTDLWYTPQDIFDTLNSEFKFDLDPCATDDNHKCEKYFTRKDNWLTQNRDWHRTFMNPPYWREIVKRVEKAKSQQGGCVVCLLPARTDTRRFHDHIYWKAEIRFIRGRLKFGWSKNSAPFPSMIVIFDSHSTS